MSLKDEIFFEVEQIDELFVTYNDLFEKIKEEPPNKIELPALASIIQTFYSGVENIINRIRKHEQIKLDNSAGWHKELLKISVNNGIISKELWLDYLDEFRATRHVFIHKYVHFLEWEEMKDTVLLAEETWEKAKIEILLYLEEVNEDN